MYTLPAQTHPYRCSRYIERRCSFQGAKFGAGRGWGPGLDPDPLNFYEWSLDASDIVRQHFWQSGGHVTPGGSASPLQIFFIKFVLRSR
jgi:hypothetical protein